MRIFTGGMLLLLLITVQHCTAMLRGPNGMSPAACCFQFYAKRIPKARIISITKTHNRCSEKAFVVSTPTGQICVSQSLEWATAAFKRQVSLNQHLDQ